MPGGDDPGELLLDLDPVVEVAGLTRGGPGNPEGHGSADDRRREEDRGDHAADDPPLEAVAGAVVGHLLDVELAVSRRHSR